MPISIESVTHARTWHMDCRRELITRFEKSHTPSELNVCMPLWSLILLLFGTFFSFYFSMFFFDLTRFRCLSLMFALSFNIRISLFLSVSCTHFTCWLMRVAIGISIGLTGKPKCQIKKCTRLSRREWYMWTWCGVHCSKNSKRSREKKNNFLVFFYVNIYWLSASTFSWHKHMAIAQAHALCSFQRRNCSFKEIDYWENRKK